ncbi:hypothetical protein EMCG_04642 [[Emmonsia] crescens]|uniref:Uncharacterized protein n=1 Tax=[Emmonsia] crescens TaxID=73230 RepID=A0A0G2HSL8_9EURO|nr:hypothetical protein EMCG_04642 [Emmonsia crescens UAMH 3008]
MTDLSDSQAILQQINEDYKCVFNCLSHLLESIQQILLIPSSFASLPDFSKTTELNATEQSAQYDTYSKHLIFTLINIT